MKIARGRERLLYGSSNGGVGYEARRTRVQGPCVTCYCHRRTVN